MLHLSTMPNLIKKYFFLCFFLFCCEISIWAQDLCDWHPRIETRTATCLDNGMIIFWFEDEDGNVYTSLPGGLEDVTLYHINVDGGDTIYSDYQPNANGLDTIYDLQAGTYIVGVKGACNRGGGDITLRNTVTTLTIESSYYLPSGNVIPTEATTLTGYGKRPTLSCSNTGRAQFLLEDGLYPYLITTTDVLGDTVRIDTFNGRMYDQTNVDDKKYNFKDYYTLDSLSAGTYYFMYTDACGYSFSLSSIEIEEVSLPVVDQIDIFASAGSSSGTQVDSNVIKIKAHMNYGYQYYIQAYTDSMRYRIVRKSSPETGQWKPYPSGTASVVTLYDTLQNVDKYCTLWEPLDSLIFQFNVSVDGCGDTTINRAFVYNKPNESKFSQKKDKLTVGLRRIEDAGEACKYGYFEYVDAIGVRYDYYSPDNAHQNNDDNVHRYHYTSPLVWIYSSRETEGLVYKRDTVQKINDYSWFTLEDAGINVSDFDDIPNHTIKKRYNIELVDGNGCSLYKKSEEYSYEMTEGTVRPHFSLTTEGNSNCCVTPRSIKIKSDGRVADSVVIDTIRLYRSPENNQYNFVASFNRTNLTWELNPASSDLDNWLGLGDLQYQGTVFGREFTISGYCLPSGPYYFEIITDCGIDTIEKNIGFMDKHMVSLKEEPVYVAEQVCADLYVTFTSGQYQIEKYNNDRYTGDTLAVQREDLDTRFKVVSGPTGGYRQNREYLLNEPIQFTRKGTYVIEMYPKQGAGTTLCEGSMSIFIQIEYDATRVDLDYAGALKCNETDTLGNVYVGAKAGNPPYYYTLYDTINLLGDPIARVKASRNEQLEIIYTSDVIDSIMQSGFGVAFMGSPMQTGKQLSCLIEDSCGVSFPINFFPQTLATMNKVWFDNDRKSDTICEGDSVQVHALEYGSFFGYKWTFRDYDSTNAVEFSHIANPYLTLPRGSLRGVYYVEIEKHGCGMDVFDSIYLEVKLSPSVEINLEMITDTLVCSGDSVYITLTPHSPVGMDSVNVSLAFENEMGVEMQNYRIRKDSTIVIPYHVMYPTHVYTLNIDDGNCAYHFADTTIEIKTISNKNMSNCDLVTWGDTLCQNDHAVLQAEGKHIHGIYTLQWYQDYEMTTLLSETTIDGNDQRSTYTTGPLPQDTVLYVRVLKDDYCPSHHAVNNKRVNFTNDLVYDMSCTDVVRLFDSGGPDNNYGQNQKWVMRFAADRPLTLHFQDFELAPTSALYVFSGSQTDMANSLLNALYYDSEIPELIVTESDTLTLVFVSKEHTARGWNAIIQTVGGEAIAKVVKPIYTELQDEVCQKQSGNYVDSKHVIGTIVPNDTISNMVRNAGTYSFSHTYQSNVFPYCDSIVTFHLRVNHPEYMEPTNVITTTWESNYPYEWYDSLYRYTDQYYHLLSGASGNECDRYDVLNLAVLKIDTLTQRVEICKGSNATLGVRITAPDMPRFFQHINHVGDVLCSDNTILPPDSFLRSGRQDAIGVVFYLNPRNNASGLAIALRDAYEGMDGRGPDYQPRLRGECVWASKKVTYNGQTTNNVYLNIYSRKVYKIYSAAAYDMNGRGNTDTIRKSTWNVLHIIDTTSENQRRDAFRLCAPAAYYCYYYNADSARAGKGLRTGDNTGIGPTGWYMPSLGEFGIYFANRLAVNRTLQMLRGSPHNAELMQGRVDYGNYYHDECYWTSTEGGHNINHQGAYRMAGKGQYIAHKADYHKAFTVNNPSFVRAIIAF